MIAVGERFPDAVLFESTDFGPSCPLRPAPVAVTPELRGRRVALFGVPGAFTKTCSAEHLPGYVRLFDAFRQKGVDAVWCVSVNDGYVMAAWGREHGALGKVRMLGDGNGELTRALGLEQDSSKSGMGLRCRRFSMLIEDGVVKALHVEEPGKFEVSSAEALLSDLG